ncbi:uncharacterized protein PHACADRAFT_261759 [Phanerochaete carnosa HHB-10118-sp]|uniref:SH3 domain-containing protein n=1 Tax=Phanerochaete carnosa (strain HHB-10118-sp) TaxID=650164 RepID=K5VXK0_PHACS|nr:uncharacterized protein PHACADRAFT_261759 [Phanerochaete carnosa HHB-10118-sp]EKM51550.1 hypothetical protein PHACADRAFT_261759 [Phanerochaete carnosa HHB-10118-sp]
MQSLPPIPHTSDWSLLSPPQMMQADTHIITLPAAAPTAASPPSSTLRSGSSTSSNGYDTASSGPSALDTSINDSEPQILLIPEPHTNGEPLTPITPLSVRPFTPTESFSFPMPPRQSSSVFPPPRTCSTSPDSLATSEYATARSLSPAVDPFADPSAAAPADSDAGHSAAENEEASFLTADSATVYFAAVEVVRRPFVPSQGDEMAVEPGDRVRVLRRYDDGWAYAENVGTAARGLFPIDCLRLPHQDLGEFLGEKRLSAYGAVHVPSRAILH